MKKYNVLVFPCGSEIALEIHRSLKYSTHFNLIGGNSVDDHGKFIYDDYIGDIPFITSDDFISKIKEVVKARGIDAIYPATDAVITKLKNSESEIGCRVVSSCSETVNICSSKSKTYELLKSVIKVPKIYSDVEINEFPVFGKPDVGYGSRGTKLLLNKKMLEGFTFEYPKSLVCEYLSGVEYTVDCFTDRFGVLRYFAPRVRNRIMNGISVNTMPTKNNIEFANLVQEINKQIKFQGAWFVQFKRNSEGELYLLEIAARLGGSSSLFRNIGVNFAMLSLFDAFDIDVDILTNKYDIELDRALDNVYKIDIKYNEVFVDFDDCIIINNTVNVEIMSYFYYCINNKIKITLLTRHKDEITNSIEKYRMTTIFDRVIHVKDKSKKSNFIDNLNSIFIDDSFSERKDVSTNLQIPVFSPDMVSSLFRC